jgi:hypothetical protein
MILIIYALFLLTTPVHAEQPELQPPKSEETSSFFNFNWPNWEKISEWFSWSGDEYAIAPTPYEGPPVWAYSVGNVLKIGAMTPTGGWEMKIDTLVEEEDKSKVFLTLWKPATDAFVTQAFVAHNDEIEQINGQAVVVYARVVQKNKEDEQAAPYHLTIAKSGTP